MHTNLYDTILQGDVLSVLRTLPDGCVQTVVTSPPYWGLRDYGLPPTVWDGDAACAHQWGETILAGEGYSSGNRRKWQHKATRDEHAEGWQKQTAQGEFCQLCGAWRGCLGLEPTPHLYVQHMVAIFAEVRRVLRNDGTAWVNIGDSYFGDSPARKKSSEAFSATWDKSQTRSRGGTRRSAARIGDLKPKDLCGVPWMVAFALRADGWWLRSDIIWHKSNAMPSSVKDRPTPAHEYLFLLSKSARYYYDADAIREPTAAFRTEGTGTFRGQADIRPRGKPTLARAASLRKSGNKQRLVATEGERSRLNTHMGSSVPWEDAGRGRNKRTVWTIPTAPFSEAHFATFPPKLITPCILAGAPPGGIVLDPFMGSGSTGYTARLHSRHYLGIELSSTYIEMAERRIATARQPHLWTA